VELIRNFVAKHKLPVNFRSNLLLKYFFSYLLILSIPIGVIGLFLFSDFFNLLSNEIKKNNMSLSTQIQNNIDMDMEQLGIVAHQIYQDPHLTTYNMDTPTGVTEGTQELKEMIAGNNLPYEVFVFYNKLDQVVSSSAVFSVGDFFTYFNFSKWDVDRFYSEMRTTQYKTTRPVEPAVCYGNDCELIVYIVPPQGLSGKNERTVFYLIQRKVMEKNMNYQNGNVAVWNQNNQLIMTTTHSDAHPLDGFEFKKSSAPAYSYTYIKDGKSFLASVIESPKTGWTYLFYVPHEKAMSKLIQSKRTFVMILFTVILISIAAIIMNIRWLYNPIKRLTSELMVKVKDSRSAVKDQLLLQLLNGQFKDLEHFNQRGKEYGISFNQSSFCVAVISIQSLKREKFSRHQWIERVEGAMPHSINGFAKETIDNDKLIVIFTIKEANDLYEQWLTLHRQIITKFAVRATIGVGQCYTDMKMVGRSYIEACNALDYKLLKGTNNVILFEEITANVPVTINYPIKELKIFEIATIEGDFARAEDSLDRIFGTIDETSIPLFMARCLCFDLINIILKAIYSSKVMSAGKWKQDYPDILTLVHFETVEDVRVAIKKACKTICQVIEKDKVKKKDRFDDYISEHFDQYSFSTKQMADYFNLTPSNLSHVFRQEKGVTITEYVNHLRIEKAKELLITTNNPLQEIVNDIGYVDVSSFVRKFKNEIGMTPGKYRKSWLEEG
jgi:two-component system, response regulator YesN